MSAVLPRRDLLGTALAAVVAGALPAEATPQVGPAPADPVFAAMAAVRAAELRHAAVEGAHAGDEGPEAVAACDAAGHALDAATATLRTTLPTTLPGLAALAEYHAADMAHADGADALAHLSETLAGMLASSAVLSLDSDHRPARGLVRPPAADPIYPAINAVRRAEADLSAALKGLNEDDPVQMRRADEAADRSGDARNALSATRPTTSAGFRALVRFHAADIAWMEPDTYGALALRDIASAMERCSAPETHRFAGIG